ncbi:hypothetical protein [Cupriavidus necator]|nr:hypothetical protein [Cupriavidus necator]
MKVNRVVANIGSADPDRARVFCQDVLGLARDPFGQLVNILTHA